MAVVNQGGKLIIGCGGSLDNSDPQRAIELQNLHTNRLYSEGLIDFDDKLQPMPGLIDKWEISPDALTYTLHLREGVKFSNGREMTMDDLVWNFNRMIDLRAVSGSGPSLLYLEKENVKPIDKRTVALTLTQPYTPFMGLLSCGWSCYIIAPESPQSNDIVTRGIGTGPYELQEFKPKEVVRLKLFKDNWRGFTAGFDEIEIRNLPDDTLRINALRAGDVDFIVLVPESEIPHLREQESDKLSTLIIPEGFFWYFPFNHGRPPFNDFKVRKAAQLAFDAKQLTDAVTLGLGVPYEQPWTKASHWYYSKSYVPQRDVEKAKQLLTEAGHTAPIKFKLMIATSWYANMGIAAQALQSQLAEIGMEMEIENVEFTTLLDRGFKADFDMTDIYWDVEPWEPDDYYFNSYHPKGFAWKLTGQYDNKDLHTLLENARTERSFEKRRAMYEQVEQIIQDDAVGIFGYRLTHGFAWKNNLKGFKTSVRGDVAYATGGIYAMQRV